MINIQTEVENARYSDVLQELLDELGARELLQKSYESGYSGYVDIDVLLKDGRVFSYKYSYGSCSGCDDWESRGLTDDEIKNEMKFAATFFPNMKTYKKWVEMASQGKKLMKLIES